MDNENANTEKKQVLRHFRSGVRATSKDNEPSFASDMLHEAKAGTADLVSGLSYIVGADGLRESAHDYSQNQRRQLSKAQTDADNSDFFVKDEEGSDYNPFNYSSGGHFGRKLSGVISGSAPTMLATMGVGAGLAKGAAVAGNALGRASMVKSAQLGEEGAVRALQNRQALEAAGGFSVAEGGASGAMTSDQVDRQVMEMPEGVLAKSPYYQDLLKTMTPEDARKEAASAAATQAGVKAGLATALLGGVAGHTFSKIYTGAAGAKTRGGAAGKGAGAEALQEAGQSAAEQVASNEAIRDYADPTQSLSENVANSVIGGALAGGTVGGVVGGVVGGRGSVDNDVEKELADIDANTNTATDSEMEQKQAADNAARESFEAMDDDSLLKTKAMLGRVMEGEDVKSSSGETITKEHAASLLPIITSITDARIKANPEILKEKPLSEQVDIKADSLGREIDAAIDEVAPNQDLHDNTGKAPEVDLPEGDLGYSEGSNEPKDSIINGEAMTQEDADAAAIAEFEAMQNQESSPQSKQKEEQTPSKSSEYKPVERPANTVNHTAYDVIDNYSEQVSNGHEPSDAFTKTYLEAKEAVDSENFKFEAAAKKAKEEEAARVKAVQDAQAKRLAKKDASNKVKEPEEEPVAKVDKPAKNKEPVVEEKKKPAKKKPAKKKPAKKKPVAVKEAVVEESKDADVAVEESNADDVTGILKKLNVRNIDSLRGRHNDAVRQEILSALEGKKIPKSKSGINALKRKLIEHSGIKGESQADVDNQLDTWLNGGRKPLKRGDRVRSHKVYVDDKEHIKVYPKIVEADSLISSHDGDGKVNDEFPEYLQPRDRSRVASKSQILSISNNLNPDLLEHSTNASDGSPIVGIDSVVESGNGRIAGIREAYRKNKAEKYREAIAKHAKSAGVSEEEFANMKNPVLVRVRDGKMSDKERGEFTKKANESNIAGMSATEQASSDSKIVSKIIHEFKTNEKGDIDTPSNDNFIMSFVSNIPKSEVSDIIQSDGKGLSQNGEKRITNALIMSAYQNKTLSNLAVESTDSGMKNIIRGLIVASPKVSSMKQQIAKGALHDFDISEEIANAANKYNSIKKLGGDVEAELSGKEQDMFGKQEIPEIEKILLRFMEENKRSGKKVADFVGAYVDAVKAHGNPNQTSLLGDSELPSKLGLVEKVLKTKGIKYSKFNQEKTESFKKWAGTDEVIEGYEVNDYDFTGNKPVVMRLHHGTTHNIDAFDSTKTGNKDGYFGAVNYFTSSEYDADTNYTSLGGADLARRIESEEETLTSQYEDNIDELLVDYADIISRKDASELKSGNETVFERIIKKIALDKFYGGNSQVLELFVRTDNPFVVSDNSPYMEIFDVSKFYDEAVESVAYDNDISIDEVKANEDEYEDEVRDREWELLEESDNELFDAIYEVGREYDIDTTELLGVLDEHVMEGSIKHDTLEEILRQDESVAHTDIDGELAGRHIVSEIIQKLGFDSIILKDADKQFEGMDMEDGTAHVHIFNENNTNIKSATDNNGEFNPNDERINYSKGFGAGLTITKAKNILTKKFGKSIGKAIDSGKVVIHRTSKDVTGDIIYSYDNSIQGWTNESGIINIVAENNSAETLSSTLLHESLHSFLDGNSKAKKRAFKQLDALRKVYKSSGKGYDWIREAEAQAEAAGTPSEHFNDEILAYSVTNYENAPMTFRKVVDMFIGEVRAFIMKKFGADMKITPSTLRALAKSHINSKVQNKSRGEIISEIERIIGKASLVRIGGKENGSYNTIKNVISVSMASSNPIEVAWHESFHALQNQVFNRQQVNLLNRAFGDGRKLRKQIERHLRKNNLGSVVDGKNFNNKEAQAYAFQAYMIGDFESTGVISKLFSKMKSLVERVKNLMQGNGFESVDSLFEKVKGGQFAGNPKSITMNLDPSMLDGLNGANPDRKPTTSPRRQKEADASIKADGFRKGEYITLHVDDKGVASIGDGNHRLRASIKHGLESVPVKVVYHGNSSDGDFSIDKLQAYFKTSQSIFDDLDAKRASYNKDKSPKNESAFKKEYGFNTLMQDVSDIEASSKRYSDSNFFDKQDLGIETANLSKPAPVLTSVLAKFNPLEGSHLAENYDDITESMMTDGYNSNEPIEVHVDQFGQGHIKSGFKRVNAAIDANIFSIPAKITYFNSGEKAQSNMSPKSLSDAINGADQDNLLLNEGTFKKEHADVVSAYQTAIAKIGETPDGAKWYNKVYRYLKEMATIKGYRKARIELVDRFGAIYDYEYDQFKKANPTKGRNDFKSYRAKAYRTMRLAVHSDKTSNFMLQHGQVEWVTGDNGELAGARAIKGKRGLLQIIAQVGEQELVDKFLNYHIGLQSKKLAQVNKQNTFTDAEIDALISEGEKTEGFKSGEWDRISKELEEFDKNKIEFLVKSGGLSRAAADELMAKGNLIPMYKIIEEQAKGQSMEGSHATSGIYSIETKADGSQGLNIDNLLTNMMMNVNTIIDAAYRANAMKTLDETFVIGKEKNKDGVVENVYDDSVWEEVKGSYSKVSTTVGATTKALESIAYQGITHAARYNTANMSQQEKDVTFELATVLMPDGKDIVSFMKDGKRVYRKVNDDLMLKAVEGLNRRVVHDIVKVLAAPKRLLTSLVTKEPSFIIANLIRDTISAHATVDSKSNMLTAPFKGIASSASEDSDFSDARLLGALPTDGNLNDLTLGGIHRQMEAMRRQNGGKSSINFLSRSWHGYEKLVGHSENANRMAVFKALREEKVDGKRKFTDEEAAFQALDILDFGLYGSSSLAHFFIDTVPFLNARFQGLYKLGKASAESRASLIKVGGIMTMISIANAIANSDNEDYKQRTDVNKDAYMHFYLGDQLITLPSPFEVGFLAYTIPTRLVELFQTGDFGKFSERVAFGISNTLNFNLTPQAIKPIYELGKNYSSYREKAIIPTSLVKSSNEYQYNAYTSPSVKHITDFTNSILPDSSLLQGIESPIAAQFLIGQYFGSAGKLGIEFFDSAVSSIEGRTMAKKDLTEQPVIKRFIRNSHISSTQSLQDLYDAGSKVSEIESDMRTIKRNNPDELRAYKKENHDIIYRAKSTIKHAMDRIAKLNKRISRVKSSTRLTPTEMAEQVKRLEDIRNGIARRAMERVGKYF